MTLAMSTATSGAALGLVVVLLLQQLGFLSLSQLVPSVVLVAFAAFLGAVAFGALGWHVDHP